MGEFDFIPEVLKRIRARIIFHKVSVKPGKPLLFAKKGRQMIFGVPGNPVSTLVSFLLFLKPCIMKMKGAESWRPELHSGVLENGVKVSTDRRSLYPCRIRDQGKRYRIIPLDFHGSGDMRTVCRADGFIILEPGKHRLKRGDGVNFIFL